MALFGKPRYSTLTSKKKDIPRDLYTRCPASGEIVYIKDLEKNLMVVQKSGYHFPFSSDKRIASLIDEGTFEEADADLVPVDFLQFPDYAGKLEGDRKKTGLREAVVSGTGQMGGIPVSLAVMDFRFRGASMGSVVGEKITRAIERGCEEGSPVIVVSSSGGARMQEGAVSLMQMAKTSAALGLLRKAKLPFISVLTNPTTGGVTASFATLGDVILAEPGALIGFAGQRVIRETIRAELPKGFQTAEFLLRHGLIDQVVPRKDLRERIILLLHALHVGSEPERSSSPAKLI